MHVEDFVYNNFDTTKGQQVAAGINNLFTEVVWYYPSQGSSFNDKYVVFNYGESSSSRMPGGIWYTGTESRTSWIDAIVYPNLTLLKYDSSSKWNFSNSRRSKWTGSYSGFFEHEGWEQTKLTKMGSTTQFTSFCSIL